LDYPLHPMLRNLTSFRPFEKAQMMVAHESPDGPPHSLKGLRHGYGVHAIGAGVPAQSV